MAEYDLYIDCDSCRIATSDEDNTPKALPRLVQGDTPTFRIYLLKGYSRASEYELIPTDELTIQVALREGLISGSGSLGAIVASQYVWTAVDGTYFEATFQLTTEELDDALGSSKSLDCTLEIKYLNGGVPTTVLQQACKIYAAMIEPDSVMPVATPTPLSAEAAEATYVRQRHRGAIILESANGLYAVELEVSDTDGTFHANPIT